KRQLSTESVNKDAPASKRQRGPKQAGHSSKAKKPMKQEAKVSEVTKRHPIVELIDRSDPNDKMTEA
ncbi:hypothetical protein KR038_001331, partial [Drosophila bunnanda]